MRCTSLLQVLLAGGLPLLVVTLVGLVLVVRTARANLRRRPELAPLAVAVTAYLALLMPNPTSAGPLCLAAFVLGALLAVEPGTHEHRLAPVAAGAVSGLLVVGLLMACVGEVFIAHGVDNAAVGRISAADSDFAAAHRWRPWDPDVGMLAALSLAPAASDGDQAAAAATVRWADHTLTRVPDDHATLVALGVAQTTLGLADTARITLDRAVATAPARPDGYLQRAVLELRRHDVDAARADLLQTQALDPGSVVARRLLRSVR